MLADWRMRPTTVLFLGGLVSTAACNCSGGQASTIDAGADADGQRFTCIPWPTGETSAEVVESLDVTPAVQWRYPRTLVGAGSWVAVSEAHVAYTVASRVVVVSVDGDWIHDMEGTGPSEFLTSPVFALDGMMVFGGSSLYSTGGWMTDVGGAVVETERALLVSQERIAALVPGSVTIVDPVGGVERIFATAGQTLRGGVGPAIATEHEFRNVLDGSLMGTLAISGIPTVPMLFGFDIGIVARRITDTSGRYAATQISAFDACGSLRWALAGDRPMNPFLLSFNDVLLVSERPSVDDGSPLHIAAYDVDGTKVAGPIDSGAPDYVGADGIIYTHECRESGTDMNAFVVARDSSLVAIWELGLGNGCVRSGTLGSTNRAFYLLESPAGTELVAVETPSPGLARTSWPTRGRTPGRTAWLESD